MLRSVFAIALVAACHSAPSPTAARAPAAAPRTSSQAPTAGVAVRQDPALEDARQFGPLREVIATGHECRQERPSPIDDTPLAHHERISAMPPSCEPRRELPHEPLR